MAVEQHLNCLQIQHTHTANFHTSKLVYERFHRVIVFIQQTQKPIMANAASTQSTENIDKGDLNILRTIHWAHDIAYKQSVCGHAVGR